MALMVGLVLSRSTPVDAASQKDREAPDGSTQPTETSRSQAPAAAVTSSAPQMTFGFNGASKEAGGTTISPLVNYGHGDMYLVNFNSAKTNPEQGTFTWSINSNIGNVDVTAIGLCKVGSSGNCDLEWTKAYPQNDPEWANEDFLVVADASIDTVSSGGTTLWAQSGQIAIHAASDDFESAYRKQLRNYAMFIQINWINIANPDASGISYTPFFAIYNEEDDDSGYAREILRNASVLTSRAQMDENYPLPSESVTSINPPGSTNTNDSGTSVSGNTGSSGGDSSTSNAKSSGSGSGLSTAAIAGIAAGCGAAVLIAAAILLWLCIRRRRRNNATQHTSKTDGMDHVHDGYETTPANHEYMADKETHPRVTESPHSPYSDDAGLGVAAGTAAAAANIGPSHDRSYTPYGDPPTPIQQHSSLRHSAQAPSPVQSVDRTSAPVAPGHDAGAPRVGSTTPHGLSRSVAALVEDGMTEDEIRRLEEEERALDAAIEHAERNR